MVVKNCTASSPAHKEFGVVIITRRIARVMIWGDVKNLSVVLWMMGNRRQKTLPPLFGLENSISSQMLSGGVVLFHEKCAEWKLVSEMSVLDTASGCLA